MKRREFLKLAGACIAAPSVMAKAKPSQLPEVPVESPKPSDWVNEEIRRIRKQINKHEAAGLKNISIKMSRQLLNELNNRWCGVTANAGRSGFKAIYMSGIPTIESEYLPVITIDKKVIHAIVYVALKKPQAVALGDIRKGEYGWVQLGPHPFVKQLEKDGQIVYS